MARLIQIAVVVVVFILTGGVELNCALNQEGYYLLGAKSGLEDPQKTLSDWSPLDATPCNWTGITCSAFGAVIAVDLRDRSLEGPFPAVLCNLPSLSRIDLAFNYINSSLLGVALLPCLSLSHLDLSQNLLVGALPSSLPLLPSLTYLDVSANNFSGEIPGNYGVFPRLQVLSLTANLIDSRIPDFLGNISTLRQLNLSYNPFAAGPIPAALGNLSSLEILWLTNCNLVGGIPASLGSLAALTDFDLSLNSLSGEIPNSLTGLRSVVQIEIYNNSLSGVIPSGFSNLTSLQRMDASMNLLQGEIPEDIFLAPKLESIHLYQNNLSGDLPATISRSRTLVEIRVFSNQLTGTLPPDFGMNSPVNFVDLSENQISGEIPKGICGRGALVELLLIDNKFAGIIPQGLASCSNLDRVRLANNFLSGEVPAGIWGLPRLSLLELSGNSLSGEISRQIAGATNLSKLLISNNQFQGSIPSEIGSLVNLHQFAAANNRLSGPLPASLGDLTQLLQLDLHNNSLSGELLTEISSWNQLNELNLAMNAISGEIPPEIGDLPVLNYLDLSSNQITGEIPLELQKLKLNVFNLSDNELYGSLPPLFDNEAYKSSFLGNPGLCGDLAGLCYDGRRSGHAIDRFFRSLFAISAVAFAVGLAWFYWRRRKGRRHSWLGSDSSGWTLTSFHKLEFNDYEILDVVIDEENVIGSGASGKVYKAVLTNGQSVAVKKLWSSSAEATGSDGDEKAEKSASAAAFEAEVATLGKIKHKNIVKLWCSCAHKDCKLLVYEFMPNGSLGDLLHSGKGIGSLDWPTRFRIAVDAAEGLSYLHHGCSPAIVHRDVKSNNILLDSDFRAKVADFGVAQAIDAMGGSKVPKSMSVIAGSCGYIAPEYAYTMRVNEKSDIYSFGVVIMELVTGKPPIDADEFGEKDLVKWVLATLNQKGFDHVMDPKLDLVSSVEREEVLKVLNVGILCTCSLPINRPSMRRVVKMLRDVRNVAEDEDDEGKAAKKKDGKLVPYDDEDVMLV